MIDRYNDAEGGVEFKYLIRTIPARIRMQGFIFTDYAEHMMEFLGQMGPWVMNGDMKMRETVHQGIGSAFDAFSWTLLRRQHWKNACEAVKARCMTAAIIDGKEFAAGLRVRVGEGCAGIQGGNRGLSPGLAVGACGGRSGRVPFMSATRASRQSRLA
jgi:hypothetical protein